MLRRFGRRRPTPGLVQKSEAPRRCGWTASHTRRRNSPGSGTRRAGPGFGRPAFYDTRRPLRCNRNNLPRRKYKPQKKSKAQRYPAPEQQTESIPRTRVLLRRCSLGRTKRATGTLRTTRSSRSTSLTGWKNPLGQNIGAHAAHLRINCLGLGKKAQLRRERREGRAFGWPG
jgi:hypothetical protein